MQQPELQNIGIKDILRLSSVVDESNIGDDFIAGSVRGSDVRHNSQVLDMLHYPVRFDGYILFYLKKGHFQVDFNLDTYDVQERSILVSVPGNIIKISHLEEDKFNDTELVFVIFSKEFVSGLQLDFSRVFQDSIYLLENPCITLNDEMLAMADSYFTLARQITQSSLRKKRQIISGLLSSLSHVTDDVWTEQLREKRAAREENTSRATLTYNRFMKLVTEYHSAQRNMQFYADKMCLTPKYLSKIVKEVSGRSGPEWIDAFVILEAKNLLRYSDASIKEIVYKLNFPNSSVFHKYFKLHTGISPSAYRKGL